MSPADQLTRALLTLAEQDRRPPCGQYGGAELWVSDDQDDRALAVRWCRPCPVRTECLEAAIAEREKWAVRGGRDFRPAPKRPRKTIMTDRPDTEKAT